ncbi:MAG TPA: Scr1 family TA system antitoxin-like transcriptional regulator [Pseudonocardiaceae bacterium]
MLNQTPGPDPSVHKRRLKNELRKARERAAKTQRDVALAMDWSSSKLIRIETGAVNISTNDLRALLNLYEMPPDRIIGLVELARAAREVPRWNIYRDVASPAFIAFLGYESSAKIVRSFEPLLVPGLLQTEEYARAVIGVAEADNPQRIDALVDLRVQRQEILTRQPSTAQFHFILDEAAIRRRVGGPDVMRRQLLQLREVAEYPNVTVRVVPFAAGMYPRLQVPYVLLEFPDDEDEDMLFLEHPFGQVSLIREDSPQWDSSGPAYHLGIFWQLEQIARKEEFAPMLDGALSVLDRAPSNRSA